MFGTGVIRDNVTQSLISHHPMDVPRAGGGAAPASSKKRKLGNGKDDSEGGGLSSRDGSEGGGEGIGNSTSSASGKAGGGGGGAIPADLAKTLDLTEKFQEIEEEKKQIEEGGSLYEIDEN